MMLRLDIQFKTKSVLRVAEQQSFDMCFVLLFMDVVVALMMMTETLSLRLRVCVYM